MIDIFDVFEVIGLFFVVSLVIFLVVFGVFFKRFRRAKKRSTSCRNTSLSPLDNQIVVSGRDGLLTYPLSSSSSSSLSYPGSPLPKISDTADAANHLVKASSNEIYFKNNRAFTKTQATNSGKETTYPRPKRHGKRHQPHANKTTTSESFENDLFKATSYSPRLASNTESNNNMILLDSLEFKSNDLIDMDDMDFSEPPPPYKLSKYFPKADPSLLANTDETGARLERPSSRSLNTSNTVVREDSSHEFENLDDIDASSTIRHHTVSSSRAGGGTGKAQRNPPRKSHSNSNSRSAAQATTRTHPTGQS